MFAMLGFAALNPTCAARRTARPSLTPDPRIAMQKTLSSLVTACVALPVCAADLALTVEIPQINTAEYHRPFVAMWIERPDNTVAGNLAVWYQMPKAEKTGGEKWLKDMRQWWRRSGRELKMPVDGVTSATRPVGKHKVEFKDGDKPLGRLAPGQYTLKVEAAREGGGRELVNVPFAWPPVKSQRVVAKGKTELGEIVLELKP